MKKRPARTIVIFGEFILLLFLAALVRGYPGRLMDGTIAGCAGAAYRDCASVRKDIDTTVEDITLAWGTTVQSAAWIQALKLFDKKEGWPGETPDRFKQRSDEADRRLEAGRKRLKDLLEELANCQCPGRNAPLAARCVSLKDQVLRKVEQMSYDMGTTFRSSAWTTALKMFEKDEGWPGDTPANLKRKEEEAHRRLDAEWKELKALLDELEHCGCWPPDERSTQPTNNGTPGAYMPDPIFLKEGFKYDNKTESGMNRSFLTTPNGVITVNLPIDLQLGEPFTGTVYLDPFGKTPDERDRNTTSLKQYQITALGSGPMPVGTYTPDLPFLSHIYGDAAKDLYLNLLYNDDPVMRVIIPSRSPSFTHPQNFLVPNGGSSGGFFTIIGPFNGFPDGSITIGGEKLPILTESPHGIVVWDRTEFTGSTKIDVDEHGRTGECTFRNVGVRVSATNLILKRGQHAEVHVTFTGLAGLDQNMPYDLVNHSPGVISMEGGEESKKRVVPASSITNSTGPEHGTFTDTIGITGVSPGPFSITATLQWTDPCSLPPEAMHKNP